MARRRRRETINLRQFLLPPPTFVILSLSLCFEELYLRVILFAQTVDNYTTRAFLQEKINFCFRLLLEELYSTGHFTFPRRLFYTEASEAVAFNLGRFIKHKIMIFRPCCLSNLFHCISKTSETYCTIVSCTKKLFSDFRICG